jgi:hypothetical protein
MRAEHIESWSFTIEEAADIVGLEPTQIANLMTRYDLCGDRKRGKGYTTTFSGLSDLMKLAAVKVLIDHDVSPMKAVQAVEPYATLYGTLLHDAGNQTRYPGTFFLTKNHEGRWVGADSWKTACAIELRAWPVYDLIWPRMKEAILSKTMARDIAVVSAAVAEFEAKIETLRKERWGTART